MDQNVDFGNLYLFLLLFGLHSDLLVLCCHGYFKVSLFVGLDGKLQLNYMEDPLDWKT